MPTIKIDNNDYDLDSLSTEAKQNIEMMKVTELEIQRLQVKLAIAQTAHLAYGRAVKDALPDPMGETLPLSSMS